MMTKQYVPLHEDWESNATEYGTNKTNKRLEPKPAQTHKHKHRLLYNQVVFTNRNPKRSVSSTITFNYDP